MAARWGRTVVAPLPPGIDGHFGPELRRFVLAQYHQGQVTVPRLVRLLAAIGIEVSKRQVVRLLIGRQDRFVSEARDVLRPTDQVPPDQVRGQARGHAPELKAHGLETAAWVTVDDTAPRRLRRAAPSRPGCRRLGSARRRSGRCGARAG
jgi:hypothetical protein